MITGLAHINMLVPPGTLDQANAFYGETLGLTAAPVPKAQVGTILWCFFLSLSLVMDFTHADLIGSI